MEECNLTLHGEVGKGYFHQLALLCTNDTLSNHLPSPSTFFIQLVRLSIAICAITALLSLYNVVSVMGRHILSTATCSMHWVIIVIFMAVKSIVIMIVPISAKALDTTTTNSENYSFESPAASDVSTAGFILQAVLQSIVSLFLFIALDHERQFRSSEFATVEAPSKHCIALSCTLKLLCSWLRLLAGVLTVLPLALLVSIEIIFTTGSSSAPTPAPSPLLWVYIFTLPLTRVASLIMGVVLMSRKRGKLALTIPAKIFLLLGLLLSMMEDFPNFVTSCNTGFDCHHKVLNYMSVFDLLQLIGSFSIIFYVLFIRSQYLRIEQESKLTLVDEFQKLLQVNGRRDIIRHYT